MHPNLLWLIRCTILCGMFTSKQCYFVCDLKLFYLKPLRSLDEDCHSYHVTMAASKWHHVNSKEWCIGLEMLEKEFLKDWDRGCLINQFSTYQLIVLCRQVLLNLDHFSYIMDSQFHQYRKWWPKRQINKLKWSQIMCWKERHIMCSCILTPQAQYRQATSLDCCPYISWNISLENL